MTVYIVLVLDGKFVFKENNCVEIRNWCSSTKYNVCYPFYCEKKGKLQVILKATSSK